MAIQRSPTQDLTSLLGEYLRDHELVGEYLSALGLELPADDEWDLEKDGFPERLFHEWLETDPSGDRARIRKAIWAARKFDVPPEQLEEVRAMLGESEPPKRKKGRPDPLQEQQKASAEDDPTPETEPAPEPGPVLPGYDSDAVDGKPDLLGIDQEVDTIARVLASSDVTPPLSLGLFGDWGSGKSFFMEKLEDRIGDLARRARAHERDTGERTAYCSRVVQIRFNAWHYSDSNLWATLVTSIFEALYDELEGQTGSAAEADAEQKKRIEAELALTEGLVKAATEKLDEATAEVERAEKELTEARAQRLQKQSALREALESIPRLLGQNEDLEERLEQSGAALGVPEAAERYSELRAEVDELRTFSGRLARIGRRFLDEPFHRAAIPLLLGILLLPVVLHVAAGAMDLSAVVARLGEGIAFLAGLLGWVGVQIQRVTPHVSTLEEAIAELDRRRAEQEDWSAGEREEVEILKERELVARRSLEKAQQRKQKLRQELEELRPDRKLKRLLEERVRDRRYEKHLGLVSLIRKDFEAMSDLLSREENFDPERPGIQRIVLYIDDLDRCRHQQVVQVLEAVHMLMAFRLFVVVVGVDPRWLRSALRRQYPHLTPATPRSTLAPAGLDPLGTSSPQEYLEKIFQIPFALRPIREEGYRRLVRNLLETNGDPGDGRRGTGEEVRETSGDAGREVEDRQGVEGSKPTDAGGEEDQDVSQGSGTQDVDLSAHPLRLTEHERKDLETLFPLFGTPRSVKRFVNCYRLLKASVPPELLSRFEGSEGNGAGEYHAAMVLLAAVTGTPNLAPRLLGRLQDWGPEDGEEASGWDGFLDALIGELSAAAENGEGADPVWERFCRDLERCSRERLAGIEPGSIRTWAARSARFSFAVKVREVGTEVFNHERTRDALRSERP